MTDRVLCLTLDVDWAPDFVIDSVVDVCLKHNVRSTWFVTHASPVIQRMAALGGQIELGIHPNFLPGSSHGDSYDQVLAHCRTLVPGATSVRTHAVYQSGPLLTQLVRAAGIKVDSSILLPEMPHIRAVELPTPAGRLIRVPCYWADDYQLQKGDDDWTIDRFRSEPGVQVYVFHPIHVYLNTPSLERYAAFREAVPDLRNATPDMLAPFVTRRSQFGAGWTFDQFVHELSAAGGGYFVRDFAVLDQLRPRRILGAAS